MRPVLANKKILISEHSIPLLSISTSPGSEAEGAHHALIHLSQLVSEGITYDTITVQGDNLGQIQYWNGSGRIKDFSLYKIAEAACHPYRSLLPEITWEYIPRERNKTADKLAGQASAIILQYYAGTKALTDIESTHLYYPLVDDDHHQHTDPIIEVCSPSESWKTDAYHAIIHHASSFNLHEQQINIWPYLPGFSRLFPNYRTHIQKLYARGLHAGDHRSYPVTYSSRRGIPNGRVQAFGVAGQTSPKLCRLLAFGSNHIELDLSCAHFSIILCFAHELHSIGYLCAEDVFAEFAIPAPEAALSREQLKKLLYLCLNSTIAHVLLQPPHFSVQDHDGLSL